MYISIFPPAASRPPRPSRWNLWLSALSQRSMMPSRTSLLIMYTSQRGHALARAGAAEQYLLREAVLPDEEAVVHALGGARGADGGDVRAGLDVLVHHVAEVYARGEVAAHDGDVVLLDVLDIAAHVLQRVYDALVLAGAGEGGQQLEAAALAGHVPLLAGAHVVEQGGVVALHDDAHVAHARVLKVAEGEVDEPVAPAKGRDELVRTMTSSRRSRLERSASISPCRFTITHRSLLRRRRCRRSWPPP